MHLVVETGDVGRLGERGVGLGVGLRRRIAEDESWARQPAVDGGQARGWGKVGSRPGGAERPVRAGLLLGAGESLRAGRDAAERLPGPDAGLGDAGDGPVEEGQQAARSLRADGRVSRMVRPIGGGGCTADGGGLRARRRGTGCYFRDRRRARRHAIDDQTSRRKKKMGESSGVLLLVVCVSGCWEHSFGSNMKSERKRGRDNLEQMDASHRKPGAFYGVGTFCRGPSH